MGSVSRVLEDGSFYFTIANLTGEALSPLVSAAVFTRATQTIVTVTPGTLIYGNVTVPLTNSN